MLKRPSGTNRKNRRGETAAFILSLQLDLLQKALAPWPRRSASLVEINCGDGAYLPFLWHCGFELTATEGRNILRGQAEAQDPDVEIRAAQDDDLPFEDDYFDWAILHLLPFPGSNLEASIKEALRIARKGLLISFWNSSSFPGLCWKLSHRQPWPANAVSWLKVLKFARDLRMGHLSMMSTLCAPYWSWRGKRFYERLNSFITFLPLGAWILLRLDLETPRPGTPLRLRLENVMAQAMPAMEYADRKLLKKPD